MTDFSKIRWIREREEENDDVVVWVSGGYGAALRRVVGR
jgi:hypothetical protein